MKFEVESLHVDVLGHLRKVHSPKLWLFAAVQWHRLYTPWVPMQTGMLAQDVMFTPGVIIHKVPYAHRLYTGHFNFRNQPHPLATREWDKAARPTQGPKLVRTLQAFVDRGGLGLSE